MALTPLQKTLARVLKGYRINDLESIKVFSLWRQIVGEKMADHCQPARISGGILYVEVDDPIWLTQLRYMKIDIQEKIAERLKKDVINDVRFFLKNEE